MSPVVETVLLTLAALTAFASNSILTRMALGGGHIDAATFTTVRLAAGACVLTALVRRTGRPWARPRGRGLVGPAALIVYAIPFSFAYLRIGAAAGALLLFGAVQLTMIGWGIASGERPGARVWVGLGVAAAGLVWLMGPAVGRPDALGSASMVLAGCAWGVYSLAGKKATNVLAANATSFVWALPFALLLNLLTLSSTAISQRGLVLGVTAGGVTSGLGYVVWYRALRGLTATQAAIVQLSVPVIAALGAVVFLDERVSPRLATAGALVLGGLGLVLSKRLLPSRRE